MAVADLALWTPVAINLGPGAATIDWGDLRGVRFAEPFLHQTIERWAGGDPAPLVRTGMDALAALDDAPALDPTALIFHLSRCGSTLLSRLLGTVPGTLVVSEPAPVNTLLLADPAAFAPLTQAEALRLLVRALGRRRFGDEHRYIVKLSSWNVTRLALFRAAFPNVPVIWLQRAPEATAASLLAQPPGWLALRHDKAASRAIFALDGPALRSPEAFCAGAIAALLAAASTINDPALVLDYAELPEAAWLRVLPFLGIAPVAEDIAAMHAMACYDAKDAAPRLFAGQAARPPLASELRADLAAVAEPLYRTLNARRSRDFTGAAAL